MEPLAGHAIYTGNASFERLRSELTDVRQERVLDTPDLGPSAFGKYPTYGDVCMSVIEKPARHPERPTYLMVILSNDDALVAQARSELERED